MRSLGVDPGSVEGAIALVEGRMVLAWFAWNRVMHGYRVRTRYGERIIGNLHGVGVAARDVGPVDVLVVEGLFDNIPKGGARSVGAILKLAEATGEILGPLRGLSAKPPLRPTANRRAKTDPPGWRETVCRLPTNLPADDAEARACEWVQANVTWLDSDFAAVCARLTKKERGALCEAVCIAAYGLLP